LGIRGTLHRGRALIGRRIVEVGLFEAFDDGSELLLGIRVDICAPVDRDRVAKREGRANDRAGVIGNGTLLATEGGQPKLVLLAG
jgi:hypothetical protein